MKKHNALGKIAVLVAAAGISVFLLAGCQSKDTSAGSNQNTSSSQNSKRPDPEEMKQKLQDNIKSLVSDGTITQAQADKIVEAMTTRPSNAAGGNTQNNGQSSSQNTQQGSSDNSGKNRQRFNPLSKLVTDGVITQAQADAVMQKTRGNFGNRGGKQAPQNNTSSTDNP